MQDNTYVRLVGCLRMSHSELKRMELYFGRGEFSPFQFLEGWVPIKDVQKLLLSLNMDKNIRSISIPINLNIENYRPNHLLEVSFDEVPTQIKLHLYTSEITEALQNSLNSHENPDAKFSSGICADIIEYLLNK